MSDSELGRLAQRNDRYPREWKIASWAVGMALVFWWVGGKSGDQVKAIPIGAAVGAAVGFLVSRRLKQKK